MLSIITPVYNGEDFIESCIKNVIGQNCTEIEHIIIDGGSTDKTVEIIQNYAQHYPHIRWISEKDKGQSDAMNKGIAMAKGEIITFLNVDDFYEKNVLNRVMGIFKTLPESSFLVGNCNVVAKNGKVKYINKPQKIKLDELLLGWDINPHPINPSAYFYHKSLHEKIGCYDINEHYVMDLDFLFRVVQVAQIKYVDEIWGNYRDMEGTKTFQDREKGQSQKRQDDLIKKYLDQLSLINQLKIYLKRYFFNQIWSRFQYFKRHPQSLFPSFTNNFIKFLVRR